MKELINREEFIAAANLHKFSMAKAAHPLMRLTGISRLNAIYSDIYTVEGLAFVEAFLSRLEIVRLVDPDELQKIPKRGPFITVSNHPFGIVDSLLLLQLLVEVRPEFKLMTHFPFQHFPQLNDYFIGLDEYGGEKRKLRRNYWPSPELGLAHLESGGGLGIFPAGMAAIRQRPRSPIDRAWKRPAVKMIKTAEVPIVPIYFQGSHSAIYHLLGLVNPRLRSAVVPKERFSKKQRTIRIRIGNPIPVREQNGFEDLDQFGRYLRAKTFALGSTLEVRKFYKTQRKRKRKEKKVEQVNDVEVPLIERPALDLLEAEIEALRTHNRVFSQQNFEAYIAHSTEIPVILQEIGRLREKTFREVGEGTNQPSDTDEYDLYYHHLFLWDTEAREIVGAYRLGKGDDIISKFGKKGFYIHSLFKIDLGFVPILSQSVELGRSFVVKEYQRNRLPLFMLWKGIVYFLRQHPECRYLIGPVSISNSYSKVSRSFIVAFIEAYYFDYELAAYIRPRNAFKMKKLRKMDARSLLEGAGADLKKIDRIISDIEPSHVKLPVLLKKYISQNAKIIGFNVDPDFNDALDGLMIVDVMDLPESSLYHQE